MAKNQRIKMSEQQKPFFLSYLKKPEKERERERGLKATPDVTGIEA